MTFPETGKHAVGARWKLFFINPERHAHVKG